MKTKISAIQQIYRDIKDIYKKILLLKPFEKYGRNDCFHLMDENNQAVMIFSDSVWKGHPGIQIFSNKPGLNHINDLITCPRSYGYDRTFANIVAISIIPKEQIDEADKMFLKKMRCNITSNNCLIFSLKEGYGFCEPTKNEMLNIYYYLNYIHTLITKDEYQIKEILEKDYMPCGIFNNDTMTYNLGPLPDISFEGMPPLKKVNNAFCEEFLKSTYLNDKCYIGRLYLPYHNSDSDYFSSVVFAYYENLDKWFTNIIDCKPEKIGEYVLSFLDDLFKKNGIPDDIEISDRYIFASSYKTLKKMNVNTNFIREENDFTFGCYQKLGEVLEKISKIDEKLSDLKYLDDINLDSNDNDVFEFIDDEEEIFNDFDDIKYIS